MKVRTIVLVIVLALVMSGCAQRMMDFSIISSRNVSIDISERSYVSEGEDWCWFFVIIPVSGKIMPSLEKAIDRAIEAAGPQYDALMDGSVYLMNYWALLVVGSGYRVRGIPVNTKKALSQNPATLNRLIVHSSIRDQYKKISDTNLKRLAMRLSDSL